MPINLAVSGAAGKMGRRIIALADQDEQVRCVAALEREGAPEIGKDAGEIAGIDRLSIAVSDRAQANFDVLIDFSTPAATMHQLAQCTRMSRPIVIGTTGLDEEAMRVIGAAGESIAVLQAPNMSVGVTVLMRTVRRLAEVLDTSYDVEIFEAHHRFKVDAPSGTALALRDAVIEGRRCAGHGDSPVVYGRHGETGPRPQGEIAVHTLRTGDTVGEHTVSFGGLGESINVGHVARSRDVFAAGAIRAAKWIVGKPPGLYDMQDVLFGDEAP
ncbi:MAG: 4-hydroxy-tetrahydrodipicolinate reductase [Planctomycetota bacterium]|nr:4-hydroxy-tetrahydrodipicolinate reductase [Planctomycetota bacterium]